MPIIDYPTLVAAVIAVAEDEGAEFANYIPIAIDLAEVRLAREIDTLGIINTATVSVALNANTMTKPLGYKEAQDLTYVDPNTSLVTVMKKREYSYIKDYWPNTTLTGSPKYYADVDSNTFIIAPNASANIDMTLRYDGRPAALTSSNTTNYFTSYCSDALFFATMVEMMKFARNVQGVQAFEMAYTNARDTIINEARRSRKDNSGNPENASTNTLKGNV